MYVDKMGECDAERVVLTVVQITERYPIHDLCLRQSVLRKVHWLLYSVDDKVYNLVNRGIN